MTHTLNGTDEINFLNLKGTTICQKQPISLKIKRIKQQILEHYLVPIFSNNFEILNQNLFLVDKIQKNLTSYYNTYKLDELSIYIELLKIVKILSENNKLVQDYENKSNKKLNANEVSSIFFKTTKVRLLPEYEIYDSIIGKPKKELNEKYNFEIIQYIEQLMRTENITYNIIKQQIENFKV